LGFFPISISQFDGSCDCSDQLDFFYFLDHQIQMALPTFGFFDFDWIQGVGKTIQVSQQRHPHFQWNQSDEF
jgi:hypothetical protein